MELFPEQITSSGSFHFFFSSYFQHLFADLSVLCVASQCSLCWPPWGPCALRGQAWGQGQAAQPGRGESPDCGFSAGSFGKENPFVFVNGNGLGGKSWRERGGRCCCCRVACPCRTSLLLTGVIVLRNCFWTVFRQKSGAEATLQAGLTLLWGVSSGWLQGQVSWETGWAAAEQCRAAPERAVGDIRERILPKKNEVKACSSVRKEKWWL